MKARRHEPLPRSTCRNCGRELVAGEHREGGLTLMTSLAYWSRADVEDVLGLSPTDDGPFLVESSAFWATLVAR